MTEWVGITNRMAKRYLKGAIALTARNRIFFALLQQKGLIVLNESGYDCNWAVQWRLPTVSTYADEGILTFNRHDLYVQVSHDWRGYTSQDRMTKKEREMCKGDVELVDRYASIIPNMTESVMNTFNGDLYIDGNAAANAQRMMGLMSFMGAGTCAAGDIIAQPSDTYAGRSTALGNYEGSWTTNLTTKPNSTVATDWPYGQGDIQYDHFSPVLVNTTSTGWGTSSTDVSDNLPLAMRAMQNWLRHRSGQPPTINLLSLDYFTAFQNAQDYKVRLTQPQHPTAQALGFPQVFNYEGVMVYHDFDCPAQEGYALNMDYMELASCQGKLLDSMGPDFDPRTYDWLWSIGNVAMNMRYTPRYFGKYKSYA